MGEFIFRSRNENLYIHIVYEQVSLYKTFPIKVLKNSRTVTTTLSRFLAESVTYIKNINNWKIQNQEFTKIDK